jgi:CheY-like chemotaxis protein
VEDDDNDALLFEKACQRAELPVALQRMLDGEAARAYLLGEGPYVDRVRHPLPQVIVLDLKLPRMSGFEFLIWIRTQKAFADIPVLVFTASLSREDKNRALAEGARSFFVKPASFEALVQIVQHFQLPDGQEPTESA